MLRLTLGPLLNNVYILGDGGTRDAVVIDPGFDSQAVLARAEQLGWTLRQVWLTHGHFDHTAGAGKIVNAFEPPLPVGLHPADREWYESDGGAEKFGMKVSQLPDVSVGFEHGQQLPLINGGQPVVKVLHTPGHSRGHVMFYCQALNSLFCGDGIFRMGIGRTDLNGGDFDTLIVSIHEQVLTLPAETRLLPGHGPESTVGFERRHNPFLKVK